MCGGSQKRLAGFSPGVAAESAALKNFLTRHVYSNPAISEDRDRSVAALDALFSFFMEHPERMPASYAQMAAAEPRHRVVCDYIAGMTDHFLLRQCREIAKDSGGARRNNFAVVASFLFVSLSNRRQPLSGSDRCFLDKAGARFIISFRLQIGEKACFWT